jgi:hypothetical protein
MHASPRMRCDAGLAVARSSPAANGTGRAARPLGRHKYSTEQRVRVTMTGGNRTDSRDVDAL